MTKSWKAVAVNLLVVGLLAASAEPMRGASESERPRDSSKYQAWLAKQVRHKLVMLPYYSVFDNMEFKIEGEKVILNGPGRAAVVEVGRRSQRQEDRGCAGRH